MAYQRIEDARVCKLACSVADEIYGIVVGWQILAQKTVGEQLIRAIHSAGANPIEGDGRGSDADSVRYFRYAKSSSREAFHFVNRAHSRGLLDDPTAKRLNALIDEMGRMISGLITYRESNGLGKRVREEAREYLTPPFDSQSTIDLPLRPET